MALAATVFTKIEGARDGELEWRHPWALLLLGGALLVGWVNFHLRRRRSATFTYSRVHDLVPARRGVVAHLSSLPGVLRVSAVALIAVALARPQTFKTERLQVKGIDIVVVLDLSKSMEERDLRPSRVVAGQCTIHNFLSREANDRIGLVVFAREAMLQCPLTLDYRSLDELVADVAIGDVPEMGTAIGDALGLALASLRRSKEQRSKVIILVSDGDSNVAAEMDPGEAKKLAVEMGVRIFTVLMGREEGRFPFLRNQYAVNPELLKSLAQETSGLYFNAGDDAELERSFSEIRSTLQQSEKTKVGRSADRDLFPFLVVPAAILLLLEILLNLTRWRRFP
jgi:Ca-activated chloride channel family protein